MKGPIFALDLATVTGWAVGNPGELPAHGSIRFGGTSSHEATFAKAMNWMAEKCKVYRPGLIVWEAPLAGFKGGKTTNNVTTILYGLPAVIGAVAYNFEIYNIRKADTRDVRNHFIGCSPKREKAKPMVMQQCRAQGCGKAMPLIVVMTVQGCLGAHRCNRYQRPSVARLVASLFAFPKCASTQMVKARKPGIASPLRGKPCTQTALGHRRHSWIVTWCAGVIRSAAVNCCMTVTSCRRANPTVLAYCHEGRLPLLGNAVIASCVAGLNPLRSWSPSSALKCRLSLRCDMPQTL
jgi:hypothetical protein